MNGNADTGTVAEQSCYIVVSLSYDRKLIFTQETGFKFLELLSAGIPVSERYNEAPKLAHREKIEISFMTDKDLKQLRMAALIDPPEN